MTGNATLPFTLMHMKSKSESDIFSRHQKKAYLAQVAGHELFGHGSGRLIYRDEKTGKCPVSMAAPINPDKIITSCYEKGETYSTIFKDIGTSFEECRADLAGLWLQNFESMTHLFNWTKGEEATFRWTSMMQEARKGILGLESSYNADKQKWNQAHTQGAYVITQFIMQNQKTKVIEIKYQKDEHGKDDFYVEVNKENYEKEGKELIGKMLTSYQVWKSLGAYDDVFAFYQKYSHVGDSEMKIKKIMGSAPRGQALRLFQNIERKDPKSVKYDTEKMNGEIVPSLRDYQRNFIGIIKSYEDRFPFSVGLYNQIITEWNKTKKYLKIPRKFHLSLAEEESQDEQEEAPEKLHAKHEKKHKRAQHRHQKKTKLFEEEEYSDADDFDTRFDGESLFQMEEDLS